MANVVALHDRAPAAEQGSQGQEARITRLLSNVGKRIRDARKQANLSRRVLSETSGVSQRYIAQLETGQGNISIALLTRIADALRLRIEWLVADDGFVASDVGSIKSLLAGATEDQLARVRAIFDEDMAIQQRGGRIAFIGLRGAGKSTLGQLVAKQLNLPFLELNDDIERASGMAVTEVMALYGQEGYRHLERGALERVADAHDSLILAVAGGIVSNSDTFNYLLSNYHTIWLKAEPEEHMARVRGQGDERPMAGNPDAMNKLREILTTREALYARAAASVDTSGRTRDDSLIVVLRTIRGRGWSD